jgi:dienelactone hydrolase
MTWLAATGHEDPLDVNRPGSFDRWRDRRRARLEELLGPLPIRVRPDLETLETVHCDGYRREKIVFDTESTMSVPAYLLIPDSRQFPGPAVLAIHGHGPGKDLVCGLAETEAPNGDYAVQLVRRGYVVLAPDLRCFGERADWNPPDHYACDTNLVHAVMAGWRPLTQNLWDLARCIDVLADHPLVDGSRIGAVGLSYGGTMSLFLAAWDPRVAAAVVSGYFSSWAASHRMPWNMCGSQVLPGMLGRIEHVDLGAMIAPRPLLVETGTEDLLFPLAAASGSMVELRAVYGWLGASDRLQHDVFQGGHQWHGEAAYPFLDRWLGNSPAGR